MAKPLTDYQVITAAEKLIYNNRLREGLPARYTLVELAAAEEALNTVARKFIKTHGERLQSLSPIHYRELSTW